MVLLLQNKKEICLNKDLNKDDHIKIFYSVTGDDEHGVSSRLVGPYSTNLFQQTSVSFYEFKHQTQHQGTYTLCFQQNEGKSYISFEFSSQEEGGHVVTIAKEATFTGMNKNLVEVSTIFEEIENNVKDYEVRKSFHNKGKIAIEGSYF